jgi:CheY-like chemotaxis protein
MEVIIVDEPVQVLADRTITRQILISLISYFLNFPCESKIELQTKLDHDQVKVQIWSQLAEAWTWEDENDHGDLLEPSHFWSQHIGAHVEEEHPTQGEKGRIELTFSLPLAKKSIIMVVDDQIPTHQMFHRFLNRRPYLIIGVEEPEDVLEKARQLQPVLITLDVMMPKVDGWEILQALKTDRGTKGIPILVCSAWEEPELAKSLGASGFLKKPVRQRDLLAALDDLGL